MVMHVRYITFLKQGTHLHQGKQLEKNIHHQIKLKSVFSSWEWML